MTSIAATVSKLKEFGQDFEFYPTTKAMIQTIQIDLIEYFNSHEYDEKTGENIRCLGSPSILDCGAGDGRVGKALTKYGSVYAIEKSKHLIDQMPEDVFIIGTEFYESTFIDKEVDVIFCNPPYSEYDVWTHKLISEANAQFIYLIIPTRWQGVKAISDVIELREASWEVIGSDNFLDAERSARANVDIVRIQLKENSLHRNRLKTDPFDVWFETNFKLNAKKEAASDWEKQESAGQTLKNKLEKQLVGGRSLVPALVELYNLEMEHLMETFLGVCKLDPDILRELDVNTESVKAALKQRITGLKNKYWKELFENYDKITKRLTHKSRKSMLDKLTDLTNIDFTETNIYAVTVWVIKNANKYYEKQLIDLVDKMIDQANVKLYKSNKRLYTDQDWRSGYGQSRKPEDLRDFGLELRIVMEGYCAIFNGDFYSWDYPEGLYKDKHEFLDDIITVANNLGFETNPWDDSHRKGEWNSGKVKEFNFYEKPGKPAVLMAVKAFKNGNMHIKFNQSFVRSLNIEMGRLKGWLHNHTQAAEEMDIPIDEAAKRFRSNYSLISTDTLKQIGFKQS